MQKMLSNSKFLLLVSLMLNLLRPLDKNVQSLNVTDEPVDASHVCSLLLWT